MAYTFTTVKNAVIGNERLVIYNVNCDATGSGTVSTPMGFIDAAILSPISCASIGMGIIVKRNTGAASAAANGSVFLSSTTNGDNFFLTVYGRS